MKKLRVALLLGGFSAEREISIKSGRMMAQNLDRKKYQVFLFDPKEELEKLIKALKEKKIDVVLPALHGPLGEDGTIQGMLELFGVPYAFSGVLASALAMDKDITKKILQKEKILVPKWIMIDKDYNEKDLREIKSPAVIKPNDQGSSVGTFIVKTKDELENAIKEALKFGPKVMFEEFIEGKEITAAVLGNEKPRALPLIEIRPKVSHFFDYRAKYEVGGSEEICPAPLNKSLTKEIQNIAVKVHKTLGCRGVTRSDFILKGGKPYFLEVNTIPGMTAISLVPQAAAKAGMPFSKLLDKLIELAMEE
ncbi:MAG: D-alanine-D-alanine ligase [Parcubacteria group bacterium LiPW_39]|nr:MAG: D-alanine-D-alanine ligase [Parcubacteria group bacterium LiPW_39]